MGLGSIVEKFIPGAKRIKGKRRVDKKGENIERCRRIESIKSLDRHTNAATENCMKPHRKVQARKKTNAVPLTHIEEEEEIGL